MEKGISTSSIYIHPTSLPLIPKENKENQHHHYPTASESKMSNNNRHKNNNHRYIPPEIMEEILLYLPVKPLLRLSLVSKSWRSMIFEASFIKRHHHTAHLPGRETLVINPRWRGTDNLPSSFLLSSISTDHIKKEDIIWEIQGNDPYLLAFCDEFWCVKDDKSLFLWNPCMRTYKKLPDPSLPPMPDTELEKIGYGLGYDPTGDDYKILRVSKETLESELYTLTSNSWRKVDRFPSKFDNLKFTEVVSSDGALHWMVRSKYYPLKNTIISFDLSTHKYGEVAQPEYYPTQGYHTIKIALLNGKLCVYVNYYSDLRFVLWERDLGRSWTKKIDVKYGSVIPYFTSTDLLISVRPLYYLGDKGEVVIQAFDCPKNEVKLFVYSEYDRSLRGIEGPANFTDCFLYFESLISPSMWRTTAAGSY